MSSQKWPKVDILIELDRACATYFAGETIRGRFQVRSDPLNADKVNYSVPIATLRCYADENIQMLTCGYLEPHYDEMIFDFSLHIPKYYWNSCSSAFGAIKYDISVAILMTIKVQEKNEKNYRELEALKTATIIRPLDLKQYDYIYGHDWQLSNRLLNCKLDHAAFVPGQPVNFCLELGSMARRIFHLVEVAVVQSLSSTKFPKTRGIILAFQRFHIKGASKTTYKGSLALPKGIALSTNYPIYRMYNVINPRVNYYLGIILYNRLGIRLPFLSSDELIIGTKPLSLDGWNPYDFEQPLKFCAKSKPGYAFIPISESNKK